MISFFLYTLIICLLYLIIFVYCSLLIYPCNLLIKKIKYYFLVIFGEFPMLKTSAKVLDERQLFKLINYPSL